MAELPTLGRTVHYRLSEDDCNQINRRRTTGPSIAERIKRQMIADASDVTQPQWPLGAQAHIGAVVRKDDVAPMIVTAIGPRGISGQVFLNGNDVFWATDVQEGSQSGQWFWPPRA
jgi:hypothetical protein